ncbi:DUF3784 domain-containing protein [Jeotgalibacillus aurantiacus]|uniref:DUF3784 domain-containing protein n=1 Tax=Jeotgalibacillus aurantiacus TaxID=2763266 RepID=UPI001D09AA25|nr:DUF3784 domain-containing protein [Jeotgalibacillus aurantiacus]
MAGAIVNFIVMIPLLTMAIVLSKGKGAFLIAGYNTMPKSEKAQYDETAICKFMGRVLYVISFSVFLMGLSELIEQQTLLIIGLALLFSTIIFTLVYSNTGDRFKKNLS